MSSSTKSGSLMCDQASSRGVGEKVHSRRLSAAISHGNEQLLRGGCEQLFHTATSRPTSYLVYVQMRLAREAGPPPRKTTSFPRDANISGGRADAAACVSVQVRPNETSVCPSSLCMSWSSTSSGKQPRFGATSSHGSSRASAQKSSSIESVHVMGSEIDGDFGWSSRAP